LSTKEPESSFGGEEKVFLLLVNDAGEARLVFGADAEAAAQDARTELADLGTEAGLRIYAFRGRRLPVTKNKVELLDEGGVRVSLLPQPEQEEIDETPEDGCVLETDTGPTIDTGDSVEEVGPTFGDTDPSGDGEALWSQQDSSN
jgi:hypothetical protein